MSSPRTRRVAPFVGRVPFVVHHGPAVWPALTETIHLLADTPRGPDALRDMVSDDAALVCAAERERLTRIVTFDRHFEIYRLPRRGRFTILPAR